MRIDNQRSLSIYAELATFTASYTVKSRGGTKATRIDDKDENIGKDISNLVIFWSLGRDVELTLKNGPALFGGFHTSSRSQILPVTKAKKVLIDRRYGTPDPIDDEYYTEDEKARLLLNGLTIGAGYSFKIASL
jgi:hypothetical protein